MRHIQKNYLKCSKKPISFEVFADDHKSMIKQGIKNKYLG